MPPRPTPRAECEMAGDTLLLASSDFGDASVELEGLLPKDVAVRLLWGMTEVAMARSSVPFMRDDEGNAPETPGA